MSSACTEQLRPGKLFDLDLQNYIPEDKLVEVKRVLYGANRGAPVQKLSLHQDVTAAAAAADFDVQGYKFRARQEQNRKPRHVKIGLIQNSIKAPTTAPYAEQTQVASHFMLYFVLFPSICVPHTTY